MAKPEKKKKKDVQYFRIKEFQCVKYLLGNYLSSFLFGKVFGESRSSDAAAHLDCFTSHCSQRCHFEKDITLENRRAGFCTYFTVCPRAHPIPSLGFRFLIYDMKVKSRDTIIFNAESLILAIAFDFLTHLCRKLSCNERGWAAQEWHKMVDALASSFFGLFQK